MTANNITAYMVKALSAFSAVPYNTVVSCCCCCC